MSMKGKLPLVSGAAPSPAGPTETAIDTAYGMPVTPRQSAGSYTHVVRTYCFCTTVCLERFRADPERYLKAGPDAHTHSSASTVPARGGDYTCPMDPEVRQARPGACPKC